MAGNKKRRAARGRGTIYKDTDPRRTTQWIAEKHVRLPDGRTKRVRARGRTQDEAFALLDKKEAAAKRENPSAERLTVEQFMTRWLAYKRQQVRASTMTNYELESRRYIVPTLGRTPLARLTALQVQTMLDQIMTTAEQQTTSHHKGRRAMADRVRRTLAQALRQAVKWDLLARNPMDKLDPIRKAPVKRGVMTPEQLGQFFQAAAGDPLEDLFVLAISTGLRKGELLALQWRDVGPTTILVQRTVSKGAPGGLAAPKTPAGYRIVPIPDELGRHLLRQRREHEHDDDPVFSTRTGRRVGARNVTRTFERITARAGLPTIRFHDLRRTFATLQAKRGTHPRTIQALLGHSTPTLAMTVYTDVLEEQIRAATLDVRALAPTPRGGTDGGAATQSDLTPTEQGAMGQENTEPENTVPDTNEIREGEEDEREA